MYGLENISIAELVTVSLTLFAVIDILGSIPILLTLKSKLGHISEMHATLVSGGLMLSFFFVGEQLLKFMGLDVSSFAIAGSIVILIIAMEMILGRDFIKNDGNNKSGAIVPIAFPLIAGSGTLTTIMSLKATYNAYSILLGILINLVVVYIVLKSLNTIGRILGPSGITVIRKFFGIILLAIAIKIFRDNAGL